MEQSLKQLGRGSLVELVSSEDEAADQCGVSMKNVAGDAKYATRIGSDTLGWNLGHTSIYAERVATLNRLVPDEIKRFPNVIALCLVLLYRILPSEEGEISEDCQCAPPDHYGSDLRFSGRIGAEKLVRSLVACTPF